MMKKSRRKQRKDIGPTEPIPDEAINEEHVATPSCDPPQSALEIRALTRRVRDGKRRMWMINKGRKIANLDADAEVTLVDETQEMNDDNLMFDTDVLEEQEKEVAEKEVSAADPVTTAGEVVTTANVEATTANAPTTTIDEPKARGVVVQEPSEFKTTSLPLQASQLPQAKDKGKAKMVEPKKPLKKKDQIAMDEEVARNLEAQLQAELEEEERISRLMGESNNSWRRERNTFIDMNTNLVKSSETRTERSSKRAGDKLVSDNSKKQKIDEHVKAEKDDDQEEAEMKKHIKIVIDDEVAINAIPLAIKPPMLQNINREDLETLWKLVKAKHGNTRLEDEYERVLWGDMKIEHDASFKGKLSD
ncbi:hypothetical protein Tco_0712360 [Tanacetum coccineum]